MGYQDRINRATAYIEQNLNRDIKAVEVAKEAAYSLFHFHRIFLAATGNTLKAYIRMRQMTQAARTLIETDTRIIEIALDAGFDSQEAFTRAFKKAFGLPPGKYRRQKRHYPSVYKNRFNLCLKGGCAMTPVIKEKEGFKVVGIRYFGGNESNEIPGVWDDLLERADEISHLDNSVHFYGLCTVPEADTNGQESDAFEYIAGRAVTRLDDIPEGMVAREVPDGKYAVFTHRGSLDNLKETYAYIYGEWTRQVGNEIINGAYDFEFYDENFDPSGSKTSELYIYIPVK